MSEVDDAATRGMSDEQILEAFLLLAEGGEKLHQFIGRVLSDFVVAYNALVERGETEHAQKFREEISDIFFTKLLNKVPLPYDQGVCRHIFGKKMMELTPIRMEMKQAQILQPHRERESLFIPERGRYEWLTDQSDGGKIARHHGAE